VGMLGPFIDTVIICMITALVIVISGTYVEGNGMEGIALTSRAFASGISWFPYVLSITVFLFAYSTMISWSYYGLKCTTYLFGEDDKVEAVYKILYCSFIVIGASAELSNIILFTDSMVLAMAIPNIIGLYLLAPEIKEDLRVYVQRFVEK
jgi:alanine or glycine:cation symporter, AGCS family